jgi:antirestriction protein ArdC
MEKPTSKELLESKITKLIETVESAESWKKPFKTAMASGLPKNYHTDTTYKGANIFFLWMEAIECGYQSNNWLTMKQCNRMGGRVNKGESSTVIFFFKPIEIEELDESTGEIETVKIPMLKPIGYLISTKQH